MSLRLKTLYNKYFPKFQTEHFNKVIEDNQKIDKILQEPQTKKELYLLIKKCAVSERIRLFINPLYFYSKYQKNIFIKLFYIFRFGLHYAYK